MVPRRVQAKPAAAVAKCQRLLRLPTQRETKTEGANKGIACPGRIHRGEIECRLLRLLASAMIQHAARLADCQDNRPDPVAQQPARQFIKIVGFTDPGATALSILLGTITSTRCK